MSKGRRAGMLIRKLGLRRSGILIILVSIAGGLIPVAFAEYKPQRGLLRNVCEMKVVIRSGRRAQGTNYLYETQDDKAPFGPRVSARDGRQSEMAEILGYTRKGELSHYSYWAEPPVKIAYKPVAILAFLLFLTGIGMVAFSADKGKPPAKGAAEGAKDSTS